MRMSLIIFGIIFLVIGGLLFLVPMQQIKANTTTTDGGDTDTRTSSASITVPVAWSFTSAIIGFILLVLGFVIPGPSIRTNSKKDSYNKVVELKQDIDDGKKHKILMERTEKHNHIN